MEQDIKQPVIDADNEDSVLTEEQALSHDNDNSDAEFSDEFDGEFEDLIVDDVTIATLSALEVIMDMPLLEDTVDQLSELVGMIEADMQGLESQSERRDQLLYLFYQQLGFCGQWRKWLELDSVLLHKVIETRNGVPISLGTLFIHLAEYFDVDVDAILFPAQFVLRFNDEQDGKIYVDPANGDILTRHKLEVLLRGIEGNHVQLDENDLIVASNEGHYHRLLQVLKAALIRDEHFSFALRCIDLILLMDPEDPYEVRDRGFLLQQLDCNQLASEDFAYFIEQCPDDPITRVLKSQIEELSAVVDTVH